jgi:hypothetical protein
MRILIYLPLLLLPAIGLSQERGDDTSIKETLRFIRLAETRKNLDFSADKLIAVNDILDMVEDRKIELIKSEKMMKSRISRPGLSEKEAAKLLIEFRALKKEHAGLDLLLFDHIQKTLTPLETIAFFTFYDKFKRKLAQQVKRLRRQNNPRKPYPKNRP